VLIHIRAAKVHDAVAIAMRGRPMEDLHALAVEILLHVSRK